MNSRREAEMLKERHYQRPKQTQSRVQKPLVQTSVIKERNKNPSLRLSLRRVRLRPPPGSEAERADRVGDDPQRRAFLVLESRHGRARQVRLRRRWYISHAGSKAISDARKSHPRGRMRHRWDRFRGRADGLGLLPPEA